VTPPDEAASLLRHAGFRRLWAGDAISQLGSQLSGLALPVLAVESLDAGAFEMGVLEACAMVSFLVLGLPTGAWVDRMSKRRVLVASDLVRALALATIPIALVLGAGSLTQLYVVALVVGACSVFFDVAWQSYLPILLRGEQLVDGNAKLSATQSVAGVAGPAVGGVLLKVLGAPVVLAVDAVSFLASAACVRGIRDDEPSHDPATRRPLTVEVVEGLRFVLGHPLLRRITACTALSNLAFSMAGALSVLYLLRDLDQTTAGVGLMYAIGSIGALLAAVTTTGTCRVIGEGRTIPVAAAIGSLALLGMPLAAELPVPVLLTVCAASLIGGWGMVAYNVTQVSFRQRLCPPTLLARMNASVRFLVWGTLPIGSLLGGVLGEAIGIVPTLWISVVIGLVAVLPVALSPLARMRDLPAAPDPAAGV
jgi:predicted MFS family arabinose efflux permease